MKLLTTILLCFICLAAHAYQNAESDVKDFVNNVTSNVMNLVKSHENDEEKGKKLTDIFTETMDIDWIGKFVLGQYWRTLSTDEKIDYLTTYRRYLIATYVPLFKKYNNQILVIKNVTPTGNEPNIQYIITTEIDSPNKSTTYKVEYRLRYIDGKFKVVDIIGEGVSLLATQRSEFSSIINNGGYKQLKKELETKASNPQSTKGSSAK